MARVLYRRLVALAADTAMQRLTGARTARQLREVASHTDMHRLDDSGFVAYYRVLSAALDRADTATCGAIWDPARGGVPGDAYLRLASSVDSTLAERWVDVLERTVWSNARKDPPGRVPSIAERDRLIRLGTSRLPESERQVMARGLPSASSTPAERCAFARAAFRAYLQIPVDSLGSIARLLER